MSTSLVRTSTINFTLNREGNWSGTVDAWQDRDYVLQNLPTKGSTFASLWGVSVPPEPWADVPLREIRYSTSEDSGRGILVLTYDDTVEVPSEDGANPSEDLPTGTSMFTLEISSMELAIEKHPDYRTHWNHDLLVREDAPALNQAYWEGRTTTAIDEGLGNELYKKVTWAKEGETITDADGFQWRVKASMLKPGVERYLIGGPVVVETRYFTGEVAAGTWAAQNIAKIGAPTQTFGISGGAWLQLPESRVVPDGRRWQAERRFQWAEAWDTDLY